MKRPVVDVVSGGALPAVRLSLEPLYENMRACLYCRASLLVRFGLVDPPDDPLLREEAITITYTSRRRTVDGEVREVISLLEKKDHKKLLAGSRSPDRLDA